MLNGSNALQRFIQYWGPIDRKPAPVQKKMQNVNFCSKAQAYRKSSKQWDLAPNVYHEFAVLAFGLIWVVRVLSENFFNFDKVSIF